MISDDVATVSVLAQSPPMILRKFAPRIGRSTIRNEKRAALALFTPCISAVAMVDKVFPLVITVHPLLCLVAITSAVKVIVQTKVNVLGFFALDPVVRMVAVA